MGQVVNKPFIRLSKSEAFWAMNIITLGLVLPFIGNLPLFDWDELNFAEIAREMVITGNFLQPQIGFEPFWEKPPLFFWLQALSMKIFGVNEFAARLPNTLIALCTVNFLFYAGEKLKSWRFGLMWALVYMGSFLPSFYFKSGIIDPLFNLLMFSSVFYLYNGLEHNLGKKWRYILLASFLAGLAVLTKGPVGWLIVGFIAFMMLLWNYRQFYNLPQIIAGIFVTLATTSLWFGVDLIQNGPWFIQTFIEYQIRLFATEDAGHGGFFGYHIVVLLFGCFPASFFALKGLTDFSKFKYVNNRKLDFNILSSLSVWFIVILFSIVQSKIVHYSSYAYFPITYLAASFLFHKPAWPTWIKWTNIIMLSILTIATWFVALFHQEIVEFILVTSQNEEVIATLSTETSWSVLRFAPAILLTIVCVGVIYYRLKPPLYPFFISMAILVQLCIYAYTGTVYKYAYQPAVDFYKSFNQEDYLYTYGYKTYADKFYGRVNADNLLDSEIDVLNFDNEKDIYIISKNTDKEKLLRYQDIKFLGEDRHFVFYVKVK